MRALLSQKSMATAPRAPSSKPPCRACTPAAAELEEVAAAELVLVPDEVPSDEEVVVALAED